MLELTTDTIHSGVGKTSLVTRYTTSTFTGAADKAPASTVGASFHTKRLQDPETGTPIRLQIWDTAGQERFRSISRLYYRGANAVLLCYDITDATSFLEMGRWLTEVRKELGLEGLDGKGAGEGVIVHVVGTKADIVAREPGKREVPFERCIAYVAEHLYPNMSGTPPPTATPGGHNASSSTTASSEEGYRRFLANLGATSSAQHGLGLDGARSPSSKRSSGFWGQDVGWDCCHEISAESGEGVEEVFRVVTRKLVEQNRRRVEREMLLGYGSTPGMTPGMASSGEGGRGDYFEGANARGSFRVGRDRRSWLGLAGTPGLAGIGGGGGVGAGSVDEAVERVAGGQERRGKCC